MMFKPSNHFFHGVDPELHRWLKVKHLHDVAELEYLLLQARDGAIRHMTGSPVNAESLKTLARVAELLVLTQVGAGKWGIPKDSVDACRGIKCTAFYKMVFGECPVRLEWDFSNTPLESLVK